MKHRVLSDYVVLDLSDENGLLCGKIFADLGADVIKIERPGGDAARNLGPFYQDNPHPERSLFWFAFNTGKRGITLNLETAAGKSLLLDLVRKADFVVESFPPGYMASLGLDYSSLKGINPSLIYVSITGFGQSGPYSSFKAPDIVVTAMSGYMNLTGDPERPPLRIGAHQAYLHAAAEGAIGALIALWHREITGEGQHVDVSAQEAYMPETLENQHFWNVLRINMQRQGVRRLWGRSTFRLIYRCKDGYVCFTTYTSVGIGIRSRQVLTEWMDKEGMADDFIRSIDWEKLDTRTMAPEEAERLVSYFANFLATKTKKELLEKSVEVGMVLAPLDSVNDIVERPHHRARDFWVEIDHPELGAKLLYPGAPYISQETPYEVKGRAPLIGQHNEEVYVGELGLSSQQLARLKGAGVI